jgi:hypothetical protein
MEIAAANVIRFFSFSSMIIKLNKLVCLSPNTHFQPSLIFWNLTKVYLSGLTIYIGIALQANIRLE